MKSKNDRLRKTERRIMAAVAALAAFTQAVHAASGLSTSQPAFMSQEQLARWNADQKRASSPTEKDVPSLVRNGVVQFYTGKPLEPETGAYLFKYRAYDSELNRWTTPDPSGFPDGANGAVYLSSNPVSLLDYAGLFALSTTTASPDEASNAADSSQKVWAFPLIHIDAGSSHAGIMAAKTQINGSITTTVATTNLPGNVTVQSYQATPYGRGDNQEVGGVELSIIFDNEPAGFTWLQMYRFSLDRDHELSEWKLDTTGFGSPRYNSNTDPTLYELPTISYWGSGGSKEFYTFAAIKNGDNYTIYDGFFWGGEME